MSSTIPRHLQSNLSQVTAPKKTNTELDQTMACTVQDFAKTLPTPKVLSWSERRAQYIPNTDAASLGYGITHRDYQRYMSPWEGAHAQQQQMKTHDSKENRSQLSRPSSIQMYTDAHAASQVRDEEVLSDASKLNLLTNPALRNKPTTYDNKGRIIRDAQGLGHGYVHPTHPTYIAVKQPRDVEPVVSKLNLNAWL